MEVSEAQLSALIQQQVEHALLLQRTKDSGTTGLGIAPHGYNALFNNFGIEPGVITTYIGPKGIEQALESMGHVQKSQLLNPVFEILTGQTASSGDEPTTPCDENVPIPGDLKVCNQTWPFGEFTMKTKPIRIDNAGELINRSEILDLRLLNNPFGDANAIVPTGSQNLFRNKLTKAVVELTNDFKRRYARLVWTGSPVNTAASTGGYLEYNGFERLVNDSYQDVFTTLPCSAANSMIVSFPSAIMQNNAAGYVQAMVETYRAQKYLADQLMIGDVDFAFVMRYQAFLSFTAVWPCAYETYRCYTAAPGGNSVVIDTSTADNNRLRDDMRSGHFLLIDGERVPVIIDTTMAETNIGNGNFQSDVYLLPLKSATLGGQLLYMDYFDYNGPFGMGDILKWLGPQDEYRVSPDGRYAIHFLGGTSFCKQVEIRTRKRIILRAPFLAARIEDAQYAVYAHEREWQPGTSFYEDGGATSFAGPSYESPI
jgi:hypothetical protein